MLGSANGYGDGVDVLQLYAPANTDILQLIHVDAANVITHTFPTPAAFTTGTWHHVALCFEPTETDTGTFRIYLDGALAATGTHVQWSAYQSSPLCIGGHNATTNVDRFFSGSLDEIALFDEALPAEDVARLARMTTARFAALTASGNIPLIVQTGWQAWQAANFTAAELTNLDISGSLASPAGDGLANLLKYALGLDAKTPTASPWTFSKNGSAWTFSYRRPANRPDLLYAVEVCPNLAAGAWTTSGVTHTRTVAGDPETWQGNYSPGATSKCFFRLKVTQQ